MNTDNLVYLCPKNLVAKKDISFISYSTHTQSNLISREHKIFKEYCVSQLYLCIQRLMNTLQVQSPMILQNGEIHHMMKVKYYQTVGDFEKEGEFVSALFMAYLGLMKHVTSVTHPFSA